MNFIDWTPTPQRNVEVLNDTAVTSTAPRRQSFSLGVLPAPSTKICLARSTSCAATTNLRRIMNLVEMPDRMTENLVRSIRLNEGKLGRKCREGEFETLIDDEISSIEAIVGEAFEDFED